MCCRAVVGKVSSSEKLPLLSLRCHDLFPDTCINHLQSVSQRRLFDEDVDLSELLVESKASPDVWWHEGPDGQVAKDNSYCKGDHGGSSQSGRSQNEDVLEENVREPQEETAVCSRALRGDGFENIVDFNKRLADQRGTEKHRTAESR